jgi:hypothetical protein
MKSWERDFCSTARPKFPCRVRPLTTADAIGNGHWRVDLVTKSARTQRIVPERGPDKYQKFGNGSHGLVGGHRKQAYRQRFSSIVGQFLRQGRNFPRRGTLSSILQSISKSPTHFANAVWLAPVALRNVADCQEVRVRP